MTYNKAYIIYFSPTRTSVKVATAVAEAFQAGEIEEIDLTYETPATAHLLQDAIAFVAVPVYGGRVAETALERLKQIKAQNCLAVPIVLYGNRDYEDALLELTNLCITQGFKPFSAAAFIGEHSYSIPTMPIALNRPDAEDLKIATTWGKTMREQLLTYASPQSLPTLQVKGNYPYKAKGTPTPATPITVEDLCTQCEHCIEICPTSAIELNQAWEIESDPAKCIKCCACVKECPQAARIFDTPYTALLFNKFKAHRMPEIFS
jgi:ferredoxin